MAFFAKLGISIGLIFSSILGLFHHGQISTPAISTSTLSITSPQTSTIVKVLDLKGNTTGYSKDEQYVYWDETPNSIGGNAGPVVIPDADPKTFAIIGKPQFSMSIDGYYVKDANRVYFNGTVLDGADPKTFTFIPDAGTDITLRSHFAKDKNNVYDSYFGTLLSGANPATFVVLNYAYSKDRYNVYTLEPGIINDPHTVPLYGADPVTFEAFYPWKSCGTNCSYDAQDKNNKYLDGQIVQ